MPLDFCFDISNIVCIYTQTNTYRHEHRIINSHRRLNVNTICIKNEYKGKLEKSRWIGIYWICIKIETWSLILMWTLMQIQLKKKSRWNSAARTRTINIIPRSPFDCRIIKWIEWWLLEFKSLIILHSNVITMEYLNPFSAFPILLSLSCHSIFVLFLFILANRFHRHYCWC